MDCIGFKILSQIGGPCRSETLSVFKMGFWGNRLIFWGNFFELLFTCVVVHAPSFQHIFNTIGIGWNEWG